jgi:hypothetical protein
MGGKRENSKLTMWSGRRETRVFEILGMGRGRGRDC